MSGAHVFSSCSFLPLPREHQQSRAGLDRADVGRGHRAVRAVLLRRVDLLPPMAGAALAWRGHRGWAYTRLSPSLADPPLVSSPTALSASGAAAAGVFDRSPAAETRRPFGPLGHLLSSFRLAVARVGAAGAHPGVDLRTADPIRSQPQALPPAITFNDLRHDPRSLGVERTALVPDLRENRRGPLPATNRPDGRHSFSEAASRIARCLIGASDPFCLQAFGFRFPDAFRLLATPRGSAPSRSPAARSTRRNRHHRLRPDFRLTCLTGSTRAARPADDGGRSRLARIRSPLPRAPATSRPNASSRREPLTPFGSRALD